MPHTPKFPDGSDAPKGILSTGDAIKVTPLRALPPETKRSGRPKKLRMPPMPQEIMDAMSELEQEHFTFFIESIKEEYPDLTMSDMIYLQQAGLEYINTLRLQVEQLRSGQLVTMSRQHPSVQFRAWIDLLSVSRKQRPQAKTQDDAEREEWRRKLGGLSS